MSSADRWDEKCAEQIVGEKTGGTTRTRDVPGAPDGTHDFDVVLPGGYVIAVEATTHADSGQLDSTRQSGSAGTGSSRS